MSQFSSTPWIRIATVTAFAVCVAACGKGQQAATPAATDKAAAPASPPVATIDGTPISRTEYDIYLKSLLQGRPNTELTPEQRAQVLDELISMQLLASQAAKDSVEKDPDVAARLDVVRMRVLADSESQKYLKDKEPTDAELHAEYDTAIAAMDKTEYHARHILVPTKEQAEQIIKKIKGGAKFDEVAKAQSTDGSKANGGDLGWFTLTRMAKPFGDAVKTLKKGEMTQEPVQTQFGWHVIKLEDTRETAPPPFEQVKQQVNNGVIQKKLQAYVDSLKKTAKIEKSL
ncbi:MAG TPA: peptidylprolyl isomerase [Steroidobacteraceae bacterium]|jgi:peptidyl-prolyl cis-trans isomerase C|nr:peptidylprolyl isomerase [Steroidobacteraceae bacterium]